MRDDEIKSLLAGVIGGTALMSALVATVIHVANSPKLLNALPRVTPTVAPKHQGWPVKPSAKNRHGTGHAPAPRVGK